MSCCFISLNLFLLQKISNIHRSRENSIINLKVLINQLLHDQIIANLVSSSLSLTLHHQHQLRFYFLNNNIQFSSVQSFSHVQLVATHGLQHARPSCTSPTPGVYSNSCPFSRWYHPTISCSVIPFSSHRQSLPVSGSFPMSQLFSSDGVSASASVLPMNT